MADDLDTGKLRAVAEAATEGMWITVDQDCRGYPLRGITSKHDGGSEWVLEEVGPASHADLEHIATFDPPTVTMLLDRLEAAAKLAWLMRSSPELDGVLLNKSKCRRDGSVRYAHTVLGEMLDTLTGTMDRSCFSEDDDD